jgi:hypothetical protein
MHCSTITTWCYNARLEAILGLEKWREDVGGWNEVDGSSRKVVAVDEMSEILVMSTQ